MWAPTWSPWRMMFPCKQTATKVQQLLGAEAQDGRGREQKKNIPPATAACLRCLQSVKISTTHRKDQREWGPVLDVCHVTIKGAPLAPVLNWLPAIWNPHILRTFWPPYFKSKYSPLCLLAHKAPPRRLDHTFITILVLGHHNAVSLKEQGKKQKKRHVKECDEQAPCMKNWKEIFLWWFSWR